MKNKLLIVGAGGHGKVVADVALRMDKWQQIAFLDDNKANKLSMGIEVIGNLNDSSKYISEYDMFVAIGNNYIRDKIQEQLYSEGASIPTLIHPRATIGELVEVGIGSVVMAGAIINCCTRIGKGCILNTGSTIDHDNTIEDYVHISPGSHLAGTVRVGKSSWLGIGVVVCDNIYISGDCIVGAGAVVVEDITGAGTYIGVPAKRIDK